jgi:hypothetical protein
MLIRLLSALLAALLSFALVVNAKCPVNFIEVHGSVTGKTSSDARLTLALIFANDRKHPRTQTFNLEGNSFAQAVEFSTQSRTGYLNGLLGEWGEKCDRVPEQVVVHLTDTDGHEIEKVTLSVHRDFELNPSKGFILRSPIVLHGG